MKKNLLLNCLSVLFICNAGVQAQTCKVNISGGICTGATLTAGTAGGGGLSSLKWYQNTYYVYHADTVSSPATVSLIAGNGGRSATQFTQGGGIALDAKGNLYIADYQNNRVQKWLKGADSGITVAGGNGAGNAANQLYRPKGVFVDAAGNIYVVDGGNNRVQKWGPHAAKGVTVAGGHGAGFDANQLNGPQGLYVDSNGDIYVADTYNYRIQKWANGAVSGVTVAGGNDFGTGPGQFIQAMDVQLDAAKNIYVLDAWTESGDYHRVQKFTPGSTTGITVVGYDVPGIGPNPFAYLLAMYVDSAGDIYTTDKGFNDNPVGSVEKWLPGATSGIIVAGGAGTPNGLLYPSAVTVDGTGNIYVLAGVANVNVQKYRATNGVVNHKFTPLQPGSYTVRAQFKNGCEAQSSALVLLATPAMPKITGDETGSRGNLCNGGTHSFYVAAWDDSTVYTWKIPKTTTLAANNNTSVDIDVPADFIAGPLIVSGANACGTSPVDTIRLVARPVIPAAITGPARIVPNQAGVVYSVEDEGDTYTWTVPGGAVIQNGQGTAKITVNWGATADSIFVSASNACGSSVARKKAIKMKTAGLLAEETLAEAKIAGYSTARIFPNPASNTATILFTAKNNGKYIVKLQDISGRTLLQKETTLTAGSNTISLNISPYAKGMYFINVVSTYDNISLKLNKN